MTCSQNRTRSGRRNAGLPAAEFTIGAPDTIARGCAESQQSRPAALISIAKATAADQQFPAVMGHAAAARATSITTRPRRQHRSHPAHAGHRPGRAPVKSGRLLSGRTIVSAVIIAGAAGAKRPVQLGDERRRRLAHGTADALDGDRADLLGQRSRIAAQPGLAGSQHDLKWVDACDAGRHGNNSHHTPAEPGSTTSGQPANLLSLVGPGTGGCRDS